MPATTEYARCAAEDRSEVAVCCGLSPCGRLPVQSAAPIAQATQIVLAGGAVPASLLRDVIDEGGAEAVLSLARLASKHRRG
jgi:hypothetical protein